jgi:hypothetical protein
MRGFRLGALLLAAGLLALCSLVAVGNLVGDDKKADTKDPEPKARGILPKYYKQLGVTEDQRQAIYKIENSYTAKIDALQKQIKDLKAAGGAGRLDRHVQRGVAIGHPVPDA